MSASGRNSLLVKLSRPPALCTVPPEHQQADTQQREEENLKKSSGIDTHSPVETPDEVEIPDVEVPAADVPDTPDENIPVEEIPDDDVPLSDVPQTGDASGMWCVLLTASLAGLGIMICLEVSFFSQVTSHSR